jgi:ABC-2 type transport system permease protein
MTLAGDPLGRDVEAGFLSRLALTPVGTWTMVLAQLSGTVIVGLLQAVAYILIGLAGGASIKTGLGGVVVIVLVTLLMVLAFGSLGLLAAVRTGSGQQVQGLSALWLALLFMSSMVIPRHMISAGWFKAIATYNPVSYLVEAPRSLMVSGWDAQALALGCGFAAVIALAGLGATVLDLRRRVVVA